MVVADRFRIAEVLAEVWRPLVALFVLDTLVTVAYVGFGWTSIVPNGLPLPLLGTGLGIFLGVRNNTAYARWWEASGLWGAVVNQSRNFARTVSAVLPQMEGSAVRRVLILHQIAWAMALRMSLHGEDVSSGLEAFLPDEALKRLDGKAAG